ncbi:MAG TPA: glycosyltransferase family 39 protein [Tepidisphaeraceae bacterium]|nr:glycosyltransferase family 39 protein [Tepidisphaeraceae bacterium]
MSVEDQSNPPAPAVTPFLSRSGGKGTYFATLLSTVKKWSILPTTHWNRFSAILVLAFILRGLGLIAILPPFEGWDEYQHLAYIAHMNESGQVAVLNHTGVRKKFLEQVVQYPLPQNMVNQLGDLGGETYWQYWMNPTQPRHLKTFHFMSLYEAQQPWLYYWLMSPLYRLSGGIGYVPRTVALLRFVNVLFGAAAIALILWWCGKTFTDKRLAALGGLWIVLQPMFLLNTTRVANDPLAIFFGTAAIVWCLRIAPRRLFLQLLGIGMVIGLGVLAKPIDLALVPFVLLDLAIMAGLKRISWSSAAAGAGGVVVGTVLLTASYFHFNLVHYQMLVPLGEALINRRNGHTLLDLLNWCQPGPWIHQWLGWWATNDLWSAGWSFFGPGDCWNYAYEALISLCLLSLPLALISGRSVFNEPLIAARCLILCLCVSAAMTYHGLQTRLFTGGIIMTPPWYNSIALPWFLLLLSAGAAFWWRIRWLRLIALAGPLLFVAVEIHGIADVMIPLFAAVPSADWGALKRIASLHPKGMGPRLMFEIWAAAGGLILWALISCLWPQDKPAPAPPR